MLNMFDEKPGGWMTDEIKRFFASSATSFPSPPVFSSSSNSSYSSPARVSHTEPIKPE